MLFPNISENIANNITGNIAGKIVRNISDSAILAILSAIILISQQYYGNIASNIEPLQLKN